MKKLLLLSFLVLFAFNAFADELIENWPDPLGPWRDRWVAQNTNMQNYYVCSGGGDENYRGNNPCGIWICDGVVGGNCVITFEPTFGASITLLEMGLQAFVDATLNVYDPGGALVYSTPLVVGYGSPYGCFCTMYTTPTPTGVGRFEIVSASQVEGNMAIDDMRVITGGCSPVDGTTWGNIKSLFR